MLYVKVLTVVLCVVEATTAKVWTEEQLLKERERLLGKGTGRSRAATKIETDDWIELREDDVEEFIGYDYTEADIFITRYRKVSAKGEDFYQLVFNLTPFLFGGIKPPLFTFHPIFASGLYFSSFNKAFNKVDLPTLGSPTMATGTPSTSTV